MRHAHHLRLFESEAAYQAYKESNDVWLPRVAFVPKNPIAIKDITLNTPGRLIFTEMGKHFIEICNGGQMHFFDQYDAVNDEWYTATFDSSTGDLNINVPNGKYTFNAETGVLDLPNFPND